MAGASALRLEKNIRRLVNEAKAESSRQDIRQLKDFEYYALIKRTSGNVELATEDDLEHVRDKRETAQRTLNRTIAPTSSDLKSSFPTTKFFDSILQCFAKYLPPSEYERFAWEFKIARELSERYSRSRNTENPSTEHIALSFVLSHKGRALEEIKDVDKFRTRRADLGD